MKYFSNVLLDEVFYNCQTRQISCHTSDALQNKVIPKTISAFGVSFIIRNIMSRTFWNIYFDENIKIDYNNDVEQKTPFIFH